MEQATSNQKGDAANDGAVSTTTNTEDGFRVLIDESFFSLVYLEGRYVADVLIPADAHPNEQEAMMADVLRRAREFGLVCYASNTDPSGWTALHFYEEDPIDRSF